MTLVECCKGIGEAEFKRCMKAIAEALVPLLRHYYMPLLVQEVTKDVHFMRTLAAEIAREKEL